MIFGLTARDPCQKCRGAAVQIAMAFCLSRDDNGAGPPCAGPGKIQVTPVFQSLRRLKSDTDRLNQADVILPNLKQRLSGVTATVVRLYPVQRDQIAVICAGRGLPATLAPAHLLALALMRARGPAGHRVWHARRNSEMLLGLVLQRVLRKRLRLVFTSASQRVHTGWTRFLINRMNHVIATSDRSAAYLQVDHQVIRHGIDTTGFRPDPAQRHALRQQLGLASDAVVFGCYGRIRSQKGTDIFVDAMIALVQRHPTAVGIVMGRAVDKDRAYLDALRRKVAAQGLAGRIRFLNETPADAMARWYALLDVYVAPQRWEGFGLTPLEAMACAVPVIATRVGAFEDIVVPDKTGLLVDPDDLPAMTAAIAQLAADPARIATYGQAARQRVLDQFTIEAEAAALIAVYRNMLAAPAASRGVA